MRALPAIASLLLVAAGIAGLGCGTNPGDKCTPACGPGYVCQGANCVADSSRDGSVLPDFLAGACSPACTGGTHCDSTNHCVICRTDGDCPTGKVCKANGQGAKACLSGCLDDARCGGGGAACCSGACADLHSDRDNCGGCGKVCTVDNSTAVCVDGACTKGVCNAGFGDCNHMPADGCEANLRVDPANCGACAAACSVADGIGACSESCYIAACDFGHDDCNGMVMDGCETSVLTDVNNCGGCSNVCHAAANAMVTCANAVCALSKCVNGFADCDGSAVNGCEVATATDAQNCGGCAKACAPGLACIAGQCTCQKCNFPNASAQCVNNTCVFDKCNPGFSDCDKNPNNGCESGLLFDKLNCGACGNPCPMNMPYCNNGACSNIGNRVFVAFASSYAPDVQKVLMATKAFTVVDMFDATTGTPSLGQLMMYDAALVFSDSGFSDAAALGDVMADYFDAGGRVVIASFANASVPIKGRFGDPANGYILIDPKGQEEPADSLGAIKEPQSPLVVDVMTFTAMSAFRSAGGVINNGIVVAEWASGRPLVVRGTNKGRNLVALNFYPPSTGVRMDFWSGDGDKLLRNALLFY